MSLYRKYRPKTFDDVVGQEHVVTTLKQAVVLDRLSHAYLFSGSRGTGKTSVARILAKILLTHGMGEGVIKQQIMEAVDDGSLVDLIEIDAASTRGIDDIRTLIEKIQFSPVIAKAKVYIIDEVHMLTREAFNALLKTLEEPPPDTYFILATTELHKIPLTIQSRCQRFLFKQVKEADIVGRLKYIAEQEKIDADEEALHMIAHAAQGGMRDAISILDQLHSLKRITLQDVKERIGETGHDYVEIVFSALKRNDTQALVEAVHAMETSAIPLDTFVRLLLAHVRTKLHEAIDERQPVETHLRLLERLLQTVRELRNAPVPGLVLESALLALCTPGSDPPVARASKPSAAHKHVSQPVAAPVQETKPQEQAKSAPAAGEPLTIEAVKTVWPLVIEEVTPPSVRMSLKNGFIREVEGHIVTIAFSSAFHRDKVKAIDASRAVETLLEKRLGRTALLKCVLETSNDPAHEEKEVVNLADAAADIF